MPGGLPPERPAKSGDVALAGKDGRRLTDLIREAERQGAATIANLMTAAIRRVAMAGPTGAVVAATLFTREQRAALVDVFARTVATGSALGHFRVRERQQKAQAAGGLHRFADEEPFALFSTTAPEGIPLLTPAQAVEYFRSLMPRLGIDPIRWAPVMQRTAFTMAAATEQTLLDRVQKVILGRLQTGQGFSTAPAEIESMLDELGVSPANPQYAQMVFRTNAMDAYNVGLALELQEPDVAQTFPVWQYLGIDDGRAGADHRPRFGRYYPNSLPFAVVRGPRVFNCRCTFRPVDAWEWADLSRRGAVLSDLTGATYANAV